MDEGVDDEVTAIEAINHTLQIKESDYSLKPGSSNILEFQDRVIPVEDHEPVTSPNFFADILEITDPDRIGASEHASASPHCLDDAEFMVEELTVRNYNSDNLAIVGPSNNRDKMSSRQNQWQHLYQISGGSGSGGSNGDHAYKENSKGSVSARGTLFPELNRKLPNGNMENLPINENNPVLTNAAVSPGGIRTKILSKSGFSEYFVRNSLKGKGVIRRGPPRGVGVELRGQTHPKTAGVTMVESGTSLNSNGEIPVSPSPSTTERWPGFYPTSFQAGVSLREWLKAGQNKVNKVNSLYVFRQIVDLVDFSHSRGVALRDLRPSCFKLLPSNQVIYAASAVSKGIFENDQNGKKPVVEQGNFPNFGQWSRKRKFGESTNTIGRWPQFPNRSVTESATAKDTNATFSGSRDSGNEFDEKGNSKTEYYAQSKSSGSHVSNTSLLVSASVSDPLEEKWYTSPEEHSERCCTFSSNIYCLGILLFELLASFDSGRAHAVAMLDLHNRILPPNFLSENPKEAGFCLWMLHPQPSSRPTIREILQSQVTSGIQESCGDQLSSINKEDEESELLLHLLESMRERKQNNATKLVEEIRCLEADIEEVDKRQTKKRSVLSCLPDEFLNERVNGFFNEENSSFEAKKSNIPSVSNDELRLAKIISQLENAYVSARSNLQLHDNDATIHANNELLKSRENWYQARKGEERHKPTDRLGVFFNGLCKYARYSKFKVHGVLRSGDFNNPANVICSLCFDRDEDYFAAAGVSKKIKIYDFHALYDESVDIHYPVVEMSNKSRITCIAWNSYIKNYMASTDYDGVVKLWDAGTGQTISHISEHSRRAWSVDFSQVDPTKLASGSDDCSVKLWDINEKKSLCTIRNIANVCCVQFSADSSHLLAFGSADYKTYCYDIRNVSTPWCILSGHDRAVSYVKFLDSETIISASTDNSLKLWDLNKTSSASLSANACILTLEGHTNEKNFVGLSVADGYVACGSETNEVFAYYRTLPMPITSLKFGSIDPISGKETDDENGQFVSSVCWRRKSDTVVAANSTGCIKLLQMV